MPLVPYIELNQGVLHTDLAAGEVNVLSILPFPTGVGKAMLSLYFPSGAARANMFIRKDGDATPSPIMIPSDLAVTSQIGTFANITSDIVLSYDDAIDVVLAWISVHE
jgi:hypothetical protein